MVRVIRGFAPEPPFITKRKDEKMKDNNKTNYTNVIPNLFRNLKNIKILKRVQDDLKNVKNLFPYFPISFSLKKKLRRFRIKSGMTFIKQPAFTLAETLITLGIIGLVAALTIPCLMSAYRKKVIETKLVKFYTTMNQAIKLAEYDYDDRSGWDELGKGFIQDDDGNDTATPVAEAWVKKYLIPYIKADTKIRNAYGKIELYFQDGSMVAISSASWLYYVDAKKYNPDESGNIDQNSHAGKDMFIFLWGGGRSKSDDRAKYVGDGVDPYKYSWDGTREDLLNNKNYGCGVKNVIGAFCTELIKQNDWKFPADYPKKI